MHLPRAEALPWQFVSKPSLTSKTEAMRKIFYLLAMLLPAWSSICGQNDFEQYAHEQEVSFKAYSDKEETDFKAYSDSVNREFGRYLTEA